MKNLIRGHIYQLKKDHFFFGCLAFSFILLIVSIRYSSLESALVPVMGIESLIGTFLGSDILLYAFMLLTANMIAEAYRSGVMKNMIGLGISKKQYYLSIMYNLRCICTGHADQQHNHGNSCRQQIWYGDHFLSWLLCSLHLGTHSFCDRVYQLCSYHDNPYQKCNYRNHFQPCDSKYPANFGNNLWISENSYES